MINDTDTGKSTASTTIWAPKFNIFNYVEAKLTDDGIFNSPITQPTCHDKEITIKTDITSESIIICSDEQQTIRQRRHVKL